MRSKKNKDHDPVRRDRADGVQNRALSEEQERAVHLMITFPGETIQGIADRIPKSRSVVSRWLKEPAFLKALKDARSERPIMTAEDAIERLGPGELSKLRAMIGGGSGEPARAWPPFPGEASIEHLSSIARRIENKGHRESLFDWVFALWRDMGTRWGMPGFKDGTIYPVEALLPMMHRAQGTLQELIGLRRKDVIDASEERNVEEAQEDDEETRAYREDLARVDGEINDLEDSSSYRADKEEDPWNEAEDDEAGQGEEDSPPS